MNRFLGSPNNKVDADGLFKILKATNITDELTKLYIFKSFLETNNENNRLPVEKFIEFLKETDLTDDRRPSIIESFLENRNNKADANGLAKILTAANITNERGKLLIFKSFLNNPNNKLTVEELSQLIKDTGFTYRADIIFDLYKTFARETPSADKAQQLSTLASALYPNIEMLQVELLKEAINQRLITKENISFLNLDVIKEDNLVLDLLAYAGTKNLLTGGEKQTLELVKGRTHAKYDFLKEVIGNKSLDEGLTPEGLNDIKGLFGDDLKVKDKDITIIDLFSYFDVKSETGYLSQILTRAIKD